MRIVFVSYLHPALLPGGAQQIAYEMFQAALAEGHDTFLVSALDPSHENIHGGSGASLVPMRFGPRQYFFFPRSYDYKYLSVADCRSVERFRNLVEFLKPDILHFHHYHRVGVESIGAARLAAPKAAIFLTFHEMLAMCMADGQMLKRPSRDLCSFASPVECSRCFPQFDPEFVKLRASRLKSTFAEVDRFIFPSAFLQQRYLDWGLPSSKCIVIPNGLAHPSPVFDRRQHSSLVNRIGYFGTLGENKGLNVLIEALTILDQEGRISRHGIVVDINGGEDQVSMQTVDEDSNALAAEVQEFGAASLKVRLRGTYEREQIAERMRDVDWVVVPSTWWEVFGLVVSEAWMFGRPVIVSDIGGLAERVHQGENGFTFPPRDARALADLLSWLIGNEDTWLEVNGRIAMPWTNRDMLHAHLSLMDTDCRAAP